jgi:hypothetical protein
VVLLELGEGAVVVQVVDLGAHLHPVQGWLGYVDVPGFDQGPEVTEEKSEQEGPDVGTIDVGVGQEDDLVIAGLLQMSKSSPIPVPTAVMMSWTSAF